MMSSLLDTVFFDVDDTLFDRDLAQRETVRLLCCAYPAVFAGLDSATLISAFLESDRIALEMFFAAPAGTSADLPRIERSRHFLRLLGRRDENDEIATGITALYQEAYPRLDVPVAGAKEVVRRLAARFQLGVISNSLPDVQYQKLETLGLRDLFRVIVLSEELGIRKPDPRIFQHAAALCERPPAHCLHVGDSYAADVVGARRAGMKACWFNPRGEARPEGSLLPDIEIKALGDLLALVARSTV